ncbi:MAG: serine hydrolase [Saprospiraceae bacterium]|nr:serine hydrolase [Saprospiraceae bacterium]
METNFLTDYFNDYFHNYNTADFLKYVYDKPSKFAPGSRAEYSNINTVLLTLIIDKVAGSCRCNK